MEINNQFIPKVLTLYLEISQYPILSKAIRQEMRKELYARGIISPSTFEKEVYQKALESQKREGLSNPFGEESAKDWNERVSFIREHHTDFYFAYNLPHSLFENIVQNIISTRVPDQEVRLSFNPELAPWDVLFMEGERYESLPDAEQARVIHHLREIKAVLIKAMISDHLLFVRLAREVFSMDDLRMVRERRIGRGKIGGKAAGMLLAWKLLKQHGAEHGLDPDMITIPQSYYIGSDVFYEVHELNNFYPYMNQKYRSRQEIVSEYPNIYQHYLDAELPEGILEQLRDVLEEVGNKPLIFRSSSLLEDSFDTAFAGKYDSFFLVNQGTMEENLAEAICAILRIYASTLSPDALIYREQMGLTDFDERMAILIQTAEGRPYGRYYFPTLAGVGFSRNPFRWSPKIRREDGLLRLVCGLGTRAVDRVANDYPRMIALSHPQLRPETRINQIRQYSQHLIDVLDIEDNTFKTLPLTEVVEANFPALRLVAVQDQGDHLQPFVMRPVSVDPKQLVFSFDYLVQHTTFPALMRNVLTCLEDAYRRPVDIEYAVDVTQTWPEAHFQVALLQCRPLSQHENAASIQIPQNIPEEDKLFTADRQVPEGVIEGVRYIVYIKPTYNSVGEPKRRLEVGRVIGRLNERLQDEEFVLIGPGRWGTSNINLGVKVTYADIFNSRALIEIAMPFQNGGAPEMAYGTHFFQDLVEARIFPLALFPTEPGILFNWAFFEDAPNLLPQLLPADAAMAEYITVIDVPAVSSGRLLAIIMNADKDQALGYLRPN